jgi:hypothetical protein
MNEMRHTPVRYLKTTRFCRACREMNGTNMRFLAVTIAVVAVSAVLATSVAASSTGPTVAWPWHKTATDLTLSASKTDIHMGDNVTIGGRLVNKASGKGIPKQVIHVNAIAAASGQILTAQRNATTNASGDFSGSATLQLSGLPSSVTQATVRLTAAYDGNAEYAASESPSVTLTIHFR